MEFGLIGEKLGHSFSADVHAKMGKNYNLLEIPPENLESFIKDKSFKGINVTIPYKEKVIELLDVIDKNAKKIGAVNTVVNKNGNLYGYNTDFDGLYELISKHFANLSEKKVLILGDGGTSKTAYAVLNKLNAKEILVVSRHPNCEQISYLDAVNLHNNANIIINTTPVGMYPSVNGTAISLENFSSLDLVVDVIYNPIRSDLVLSAQRMGVKAVGGLYMLIAQAVSAAEYFDDKKYDQNVIKEIFTEILKNKSNIVLTGMPGCGKSTVGKIISEKMNRQFVDTDSQFTEKTGFEITEFFSKFGEAEFRRIESEIIAEVSLKNGLVISTGGGAVLNNDNIRNLKHNGVVFFLERNLEDLVPTDDRPLSRNFKDLVKIYNQRIDIYNSTNDFKVQVTFPEATANEIIQNFEGLDG